MKNIEELTEKLTYLKRLPATLPFSSQTSIVTCPHCQAIGLYQVLSYETPIAEVCFMCHHVWLNVTKYSAMTSKQQALLRQVYGHLATTEIDDVPYEVYSLHVLAPKDTVPCGKE